MMLSVSKVLVGNCPENMDEYKSGQDDIQKAADVARIILA